MSYLDSSGTLWLLNSSEVEADRIFNILLQYVGLILVSDLVYVTSRFTL